MSVLDRTALEESPLADLHEIASELSIDGYRRLRRAELIGAILDKQGGPEESHRESEDAPTGAVQDRDDGRAASTDDREHPSSAEDEVPAESTAGREGDGEAAASAGDQEDDREPSAAANGEERDAEATEASDADADEVPAPRRRRGRRGGRGRSSAREEAVGRSSRGRDAGARRRD